MRVRFNFLLAILFTAVPAAAAEAPAGRAQCPQAIGAGDSALQQGYVEFQRRIEAGPFFARFGRPVSCQARAEGDSISLMYEFPNGTTLEARRDPAIEHTEVHLARTRLSKQAALTFLRRTERWFFGGQRCGIAWTKPPSIEAGATPDRKDRVYRGDACNCQGRLEYTGAVITGLVFRSAC